MNINNNYKYTHEGLFWEGFYVILIYPAIFINNKWYYINIIYVNNGKQKKIIIIKNKLKKKVK